MQDYGFEIYRPSGALSLSTRETLLRLVHIERCAADFDGTFSVPEFDAIETATPGIFSGQGFFYVQYRIGRRDDPDRAGDAATLGSILNPGLDWDNSTKQMTVTPIPIYRSGVRRTDYEIIFMHFR